MLQSTPLTSEEITTLESCSLHAQHPRQRRRAQAILGHHRGHSLNQLAAFYAVPYATVHAWLRAWRDHGLVGLAEGKRAGRPPKLAAPTKKK
ncbi:MAG: helix-turn-helix domain-containing protein [Cytophagaceae bacterium]|nr:MAG: helix-turn-helix domain-containing protein [Cytophagaceae bacterium]